MIKKTISVLLLLTLSQTAMSETAPRKMVVSAEPVKAVHGSLGALFQRKLTNYLALTVPVFFGTDWFAHSYTGPLSAITEEKYETSYLFGGGGLGARFMLNNKGLSDGFFAEPRLVLNMSKFHLKREGETIVDSNRLTLLPSVHLGYSWFWDTGFYLSTSLEVGYGYHVKNSVTVDKKLEKQVADNSSVKRRLWANQNPWHFHYGYDISLGFAW